MIAPTPGLRGGEGSGCDGIALTHPLQATMGVLSGEGIALNRGPPKGRLPGRVEGIALNPSRGPLGGVEGIALKPPKALQREVDGDARKPP